MTEINFGSTYRIPISQAGINPAKKVKLKELIESYPNGLIGKSKTGYARVSVPDSEDASFIGKLRKVGYKVYQKFEGENIDKEDLDIFIKERLDSRDFNQKGKNPERLSRKIREQRRFDRGYTAPQKAELPEQEVILENNSANVVKDSVIDDSVDFGFQPRRIKTPEEIRQSEGYIKLVEEEGKEFAEAVYFGIKK